MIDTKHILTVGVDDSTKAIYDNYISELNRVLPISESNSKAALKSLMNILITLEENKDIRKGYNSLPSFFITHRMMYMKLFDFLTEQGFDVDAIDGLIFKDEMLELQSGEEFIDHFRDAMESVFQIFKPFMEADDDVDRFSRMMRIYTDFLKSKNDVGSMIRLIHHFSGFCDDIYLEGYKKLNDGWGGKLDLDQYVYPVFFKEIIREAVEPYNYSDYVIDFLYDRLKEVGEAETVLPGLYDFAISLSRDGSLSKDIKKADEALAVEIKKTISLVEKQKGEALSENAKRKVIAELTAYEVLEGLIYYYFDEKRLLKIMRDTKNEQLFEPALAMVKDYTPKIKHFVMYALGKLVLAPNTQIKMNEVILKMFCNNIKADVETINGQAVMNNLPSQYRQRVPDLEVRFFLNRIMTNTTMLEGFEPIEEQFRTFMINQSELPLIHEMFIERAAERRHASAIMSFYIAAMLTQELGDVMPDQIIKILAGRLSLTYSFTRRINLYREIKKLRYEYDGTHAGKDTLHYNGFDRQNMAVPEKERRTPLKDRPLDEQWIILYHVINNRELQLSLRLIDEEVLFDYILAKADHEKELESARMDLRGKVYKIVDDKFLDLLSDEEEHAKRDMENRGEFPVAYYAKYEKIRSILIAQFLASGWDMEVYELKRTGKRPLIKLTQNELLRSIKNIDAKRILEQYEYKEARENIDVHTLRKQVETREQLLSFINQISKEELQNLQKITRLGDEAIALLSYSSTKLRSNELKVELGIKQLVERLKCDLGLQASREPLPLDAICRDCFDGKYGKVDVKVIKKDKSGKPMIDPETGEEAEKTYTIVPDKFPDYLEPARKEVLSLDKATLYRVFYAITLQSIVAETFSSMAFIKEALATNKYVIAADGLKEQAIENHEILDYARIRFDMANQLAPYMLQYAS